MTLWDRLTVLVAGCCCLDDPQGKQALVTHCLQPGVSVAGAALQAGVNANLLRKWILSHQRESGSRQPAVEYRGAKSASALIPVVVHEQAPPAAATAPTLQRDLGNDALAADIQKVLLSLRQVKSADRPAAVGDAGEAASHVLVSNYGKFGTLH